MSDQEREIEARWQRLRKRLTSSTPPSLPPDLLHLARAVAGAQDPDMSCEVCQGWLPTYVDDEVGGLNVTNLHPAVKQHLELCSECESVYLEMLKLALVEEEGLLSAPTQTPRPNLDFLPPLSEPPLTEPDYIQSLAEKIVAVLAPHLLDDLQIVGEMFFERIAELGEQFKLSSGGLAPALSFRPDEIPEVLPILAATYAGTRALIEKMSLEELQTPIKTEQLSQKIWQQSAASARQMGLSEAQARRFADQYTELVVKEPEKLKRLIE